MPAVDQSAASPSPKSGTDWFKILGLGFLAVVSIDVISLFVAGMFHWTLMLKLALAAFVYLQMGMTVASLGSFPVTLLMTLRRNFAAKPA